ncbi:TauD/TfdA family dioxygenase [Micromonospora maritima]|uniref:TauD/TfdA family dioxygenase n=1 Tax=Micromonospora maritima TaxID=986711 RepID=UPI00379A9D5C
MNGSNDVVTAPTAWRGEDLTPESWQLTCDDRDLTELAELGEKLDASGVTLESATPADLDVQVLRRVASRIADQLASGPGVVLMRTWPVAEWGLDTSGVLLWGLGTLIGDPLPQNNNGRRLSSVSRQVVTAGRFSESARRGSRSDEEIDFHTENALPPRPPRVISLMCGRPAAEGGESAFVSGHTIYNQLLRDAPEAVEILSRPMPFGRQEGDWADGKQVDVEPVFQRDGNKLRVRFNRYWLDRGAVVTGHQWDDDTKAAFDAFEAAAHRPGNALVHRLDAGETVFVDNNVVLHARRRFTDRPAEAGAGRMLWRLWCA